jgi:hypothetical protein
MVRYKKESGNSIDISAKAGCQEECQSPSGVLLKSPGSHYGSNPKIVTNGPSAATGRPAFRSGARPIQACSRGLRRHSGSRAESPLLNQQKIAEFEERDFAISARALRNAAAALNPPPLPAPRSQLLPISPPHPHPLQPESCALSLCALFLSSFHHLSKVTNHDKSGLPRQESWQFPPLNLLFLTYRVKKKKSRSWAAFVLERRRNLMQPYREATLANESVAYVTYLTYFQSLSPFASVNESIASANDSLTLATHLPCFHQDKGVTKVTPLPTSFESITTPQTPPGPIFTPAAPAENPARPGFHTANNPGSPPSIRPESRSNSSDRRSDRIRSPCPPADAHRGR